MGNLADAMDTLSLIAPMLGVVAVIILAYLTTKWLAGRSVVKPTGKRIRVIERVPLTRDTYLALVRVKGRTYLLSVGPGRVEQISEVEGGAPAREEDDFESLLSQRMRRYREEPPEPRRPAREERSARGEHPARSERPVREENSARGEHPARSERPVRDKRPRGGARL